MRVSNAHRVDESIYRERVISILVVMVLSTGLNGAMVESLPMEPKFAPMGCFWSIAVHLPVPIVAK